MSHYHAFSAMDGEDVSWVRGSNILGWDRFKPINDSLGHAIGDAVLQSVAKRLRDALRNTDTVSRQGGDEFVILLPEIEDANDAVTVAEKLLAVLAAPNMLAGGPGKHSE